MPFRPRNRRDLDRACRAGQAARTQGQAATAVALAQIQAAFDEAAVANGFKLRIERLLRLGPHHPAVRARFGARAELLKDRGLDDAIALVERWRRDERKAFQIASALGGGNRLSVEVLAELRLVLRLMRSKRMQAEFCRIAEVVCDEPMAIAAE
jgi:hypothetical protein